MSDSFYNLKVPNFAKKQVQPGEFFGYLFCTRDSAHLTHLYQPDKSIATHLALKDVYEDLTDLIDSLVEKYQGIHGLIKFEIPKSESYEDPLVMIQEKYDWIVNNRNIFSESWMQNIIDQVVDTLATALYKLKFVKC